MVLEFHVDAPGSLIDSLIAEPVDIVIVDL
jgi:hypothetical protein